MTQEQADRRVVKGAAYLDRKVPGWFKKVKIGNRLLMWSSCDCVVGQLEGNFWLTVRRWMGGKRTLEKERAWVVSRGFWTLLEDDYPPLRRAWVAAIRERRAAA